MRICNLTQHDPTPEQVKKGVENLPKEAWDEVKRLMTFNSLKEAKRHGERAEKIAEIAANNGCKRAMIGGAPYLMPRLENSLKKRNITPYYAFSKRVSKEEQTPDGKVIKRNVFQFEGFIKI